MTRYTERIQKALAQVKGPRVLHVGACGTTLPQTEFDRSRWLHTALVDSGFSTVGGDINRSALRAMEEQGYEVMYLNAQDIPEHGERFDTIIAGELIEHLENPGLFLTGALRRLQDDGRLVLTTPNAFCPVYLAGYVWKYKKLANPEHTCWLDPQTLEQLLQRSGYRVEELRFVNNISSSVSKERYRLLASSWKAISSLLPNRMQSTMVVQAVPQP